MATKKTAAARSGKKAASSDSADDTSGDSTGSTEGTSTTKRTTRKTAKKTTSKAAPRTSAPRRSTSRESDGGPEPRAASRPKRAKASVVAASAAQQLLELTGKSAEGVTGLERVEDGWKVQVEVVEVRRIPDTTDVLALYEVQVDDDGDMTGYRRVRRYARGVPGED